MTAGAGREDRAVKGEKAEEARHDRGAGSGAVRREGGKKNPPDAMRSSGGGRSGIREELIFSGVGRSRPDRRDRCRTAASWQARGRD
jgi:hypothetical protein